MGGMAPRDGAPLQRSQQRLSLTFKKEEDEEEKKEKNKTQTPKEFQWDEVPPPLREYLGENKKRSRSKSMSFL